MGQGYQDRDSEIIDYQLYQPGGFRRPLRGPKPGPLLPGRYLTCIGAAQTFGCYTPHPYPALLGESLNCEVVNLGVAGAGPEFFNRRPEFIEVANASGLVVLQVLSGRSVSNSVFESRRGEWLRRRSDGFEQGAAPAYDELLQTWPKNRLDGLLQETQQNWTQQMHALIDVIRVPIILLWFSQRETDYVPDRKNVHTLLGVHPQLVQPPMLEALVPRVCRFIKVVSSAGLPQALVSRYTGKPATITARADLGGEQQRVNNYYPSPAMHRQALMALEPACRELLAQSTTDTR